MDVEADINATWAPNVPQEEPVINKDIEIVEDEQEYTDKEEEAIDVLLDTMNEIQHNIKKLNPVTLSSAYNCFQIDIQTMCNAVVFIFRLFVCIKVN